MVANESKFKRGVTIAFLLVTSLMWLFPLLWAVFNSFRDYGFTLEHGYFSFGGFTLDNWKDAWAQGGFANSFVNSAVITITAVVLTLALSTCMAFVLARYSFRFNVAMLIFFVAANLLPPQSLLVPVYRIFKAVPLPTWIAESGSLLDTYGGVILINVAFQTGFCTFVLSNYMKAIPTPSLHVVREHPRAVALGARGRRRVRGSATPNNVDTRSYGHLHRHRTVSMTAPSNRKTPSQNALTRCFTGGRCQV